MKIRLVQFFVFLFVLILPLAALAQVTGQITGTVRDNTGAVVVGAQVAVSNPAKGMTRTTTTNSSGDYLVAGLGAGTYDVSVTASGFQKYSAKGVVLDVGEKTRVDVNLTVGAVNTEVVVSGEAIAQVETQSSELSGTVTGNQISQLSLNGRNFTQLVTLVPGVSNQTGQDEGTVGVYGNVAYSMNGGRTEYNNWELDGGDNMDNGSNATLNVYPNLDAIGEFRVLTSNYGAQYGRNGSGTIEVETKSGTNKFHGTADYYGRNEIFNARNYFDTTKPPYKKHDWGYTVGGPVILPGYNKNRDKTFFFWSEEWRREKNPSTFLQNVPSDAERGGDFTDVCPDPNNTSNPNENCPIDPRTGQLFNGSLGPMPLDPNGALLLPLIPNANSTESGYPAYRASLSFPTTWREELVRVDHNITPKVRATVRYIHDSWNTVTPTTLWANYGATFPTLETNFTGPGVSLVSSLSATISPTLLNEFVFSFTTDHISLWNVGPWQRPSTMTMTSLFNNGFGGKIPGISIANGQPYGGGFGEDPDYIPNGKYNSNPTYTFRDNVTKIVGKHNFLFGAYAVAAEKNELSFLGTNGFLTFDRTVSVSSGNAFADLLLGNIASYLQSSAQPKYYNRYKILEPYIQDDWRATSRLTLNLGLRLSLYGTYRERYKQAYSFTPGAWGMANAPQIDVDGSVTGQAGALIPAALGGTGNPFNGVVQCGGSGGSVTVPGYPGSSAGGNPNAGCVAGHLFNPAPRIGFAWDPKGNGKMAIRGGYGIFYEHTNGNEGNTESLEASAPAVLTPTQYLITGYTNIGGGALLFPLSVVSIPEKAIWPYMQQWHFDIQQEILHNTVATVSYVGSKGTHLTLQRNINQLHPVPSADNPFAAGQPITDADCTSFAADGTLANGTPVGAVAGVNLGVACGNDPNPFRPNFYGYGTVKRLEDVANSSYNALQATLRRTVGALNFSVAYTYSHSIDDSSDRYDSNFLDSYNLARTRASSNFDQRHLLNISYSYNLPVLKGSSMTDHLLGSWQITGLTSIETGTPFSVTNGIYGDNPGVANGVGTGSYVDLIGDPHATPATRNIPGVTGPLLFNPAAFAAPQGLTFGNSGRNVLNNPRRTNFDMALFKRFPIHEAVGFEFRAEAFNIFNHTQWSGVNGGTDCYAGANFSAGDASCVASSGFLHPSGAHRARTMQFGLKFTF